MKIPKQLQRAEFKFILLKGKVPVKPKNANNDFSWKDPKYQFTVDDPIIYKHIQSGGNLGVICGFGNLIVVDVDCKQHIELFEKIKEILPPTLVVRTGKKGFHLFYISSTLPRRIKVKKIKLTEPKEAEVEMRCSDCYVVAPPSVHPETGRRYKVINDAPIAKLSEEDYARLLDFLLTHSTDGKEKIKTGSASQNKKLEKLLGKILEKLDYVDRGNYILASCPFHKPDRNPSFVIYKNTMLGVDFHTNEIYTLKELAKKLKLKTKAYKEEGEAKPIKLSELTAQHVGKKVTFECQLVGDIVGKAIGCEALVKCKACGGILDYVDLKEESNFRLLHRAFLKKISVRDLADVLDFSDECPESGGKHHPYVTLSEDNVLDYSILFVRELPENITAENENTYRKLAAKTWKVYFLGIPKDIKKAQITGYVVKNPSSDEIEIIAYKVKPAAEEFARVNVTPQDHKAFERYFAPQNLSAIASNQIAPKIIDRDFAKLSALLVLHSPLEIYDIFQTARIRGYLRAIWIGDTKTGKSETGKDLTYAYYKIGEMVFGEMSSRAGLTYTIDTDKRAIIWGSLPLNDCKFIFLDGIHSLASEEMEQLREALEQGVIKVRRSVAGERLARVRMIATLNPRNPPMSNYFFKIQALMDTRVFKDPVDLTRWDIAAPFCIEDVKSDAIAEARPGERPIPKDVFLKHVYWAWSLRPEQIMYTQEACKSIIGRTKDLMEFVSSQYPLIHSGAREHLTRLSVAFACLTHSVTEDLEHVEVKREHVEYAYSFLMEMIQRIDYDAFIYQMRGIEKLNEEEFGQICKELSELELEILKQLTTGAKKSPELAARLGLSDRAIKEHYKVLRKHNLIITSTGFGVKLTARGIAVLKKMGGRLPSGEVVKRGEAEAPTINFTSLHHFTSSDATPPKNFENENNEKAFIKAQIIEIFKKHKTLDLNQYDQENVAKIKPLIEEMLKSGEIKEVKHNVFALGKVIECR